MGRMSDLDIQRQNREAEAQWSAEFMNDKMALQIAHRWQMETVRLYQLWRTSKTGEEWNHYADEHVDACDKMRFWQTRAGM